MVAWEVLSAWHDCLALSGTIGSVRPHPCRELLEVLGMRDGRQVVHWDLGEEEKTLGERERTRAREDERARG